MPLSAEAADAAFEAILAAVQEGRRAEALQLATAALAEGLDEPLVLLLAAEALEDEGRAPDAIALLRQASVIAPEEPEPWQRLAAALIRAGQDAEALPALDAALALRPDNLPLLLSAAAAAYRVGQLGTAEARYRRALLQAPQGVDALAGLAAVCARQDRPEEALALAGQALALRPGLPTAELAAGRAELLTAKVEAAGARMARLLADPALDAGSRIAALDLRAEAWDQADRTAEAFADYASRNALLRARHAAEFEHEAAGRRVDQARWLAASLAATDPAPWRATPGRDEAGARTARGHVFLLGFPRSGTTLLEKALAAHPAIATLEEVDHLGRIGAAWLGSAMALQALAHMSPEQARSAREAYWAGVRETLGGALPERVLVDKLPLHTLSLPVIAKLFPDARILFALRDPRDVVFSCFRRRFRMNAAMFEFLRLEDAAAYYDAVMHLAALCRDRLPLTLLEVRHEDVVGDVEATLRRVLGFIGLEWNPAVARLAARPGADPRTPSDMQLRRGLNAEGIGQWRRYADCLAPVLPMLAPWVARYGYEPCPQPAPPPAAGA